MQTSLVEGLNTGIGLVYVADDSYTALIVLIS